jgi:serine/threonine protein kinase
MHERHIMYRDMKAENILLDARGYCKIADFGLSKFCMGRAYTLCGTPEYMAPEFKGQNGHTCACDWWSLGALLFELMTGHPPFDGDQPMQILQKASEGIERVKFPSDGHWASMVRDLCKLVPEERLPVRDGGFANFEAHPWYSDTAQKPMWVWRVFDLLAMKPPYKPEGKANVSSCVDHGDPPPTMPYTNDGSGWDLELQDTIGPEPEKFAV